MAALPFELIEVILKNLYTNPFSKPACLAACSLVCRGWRPIAQALFFSEVSIPDGPNRPPVQPGQDDLYPWSTENPNLQLYVRRLWIRSLQESRIGKLASSLPNLEQLVIFDPSKLDGNETIPSRIMDSLYENIHSNHLTSLCISNVVDFPVHTFYLCSSLRELKIRGTSFEGLRADTHTFEHEESLDYARSLDPDPSPRPRLQSLHLSISSPGSVGIFLWLLTPGCAFDLSELKTLHCLDRTDAIACFSRVVRLVDFVSSSLEDLMVDPPTWCSCPPFLCRFS
ncbi:hypothetical protein BDN72DRAFT_839427 [Pluteus cervinus]|uniref:Uncharacterized protein n=1 Tax=Pluteus cervinus TaxID=181527 RepID=A0ACD3AWN5_9AGAR|nr:hypothetical protein BDN72DRAFT_839427 [Pluteus cervinus]